jgi:hypothetical protein
MFWFLNCQFAWQERNIERKKVRKEDKNKRIKTSYQTIKK